MQADGVVVVVLGGLGDSAGQVDREPAHEECLHGQPVVRHREDLDDGPTTEAAPVITDLARGLALQSP